MESFRLENRSAGTFLTYSLQQEEQLDGFTLGMLSNNRIPGIFPVQFVQVNSERQFIYNVTSKVSLSQYIAGKMKKGRCLEVLKGIAETVLRCNEYLLEISSLIFETDYIFVDVTTCELSMICLPVFRESPVIDVRAFLRDLLSSMTFSEDEDLEYPARLLNLLNEKGRNDLRPDKGSRGRAKGPAYACDPGFSLERFIEQIDKIRKDKKDDMILERLSGSESDSDSGLFQNDWAGGGERSGKQNRVRKDKKSTDEAKVSFADTSWPYQEYRSAKLRNGSSIDTGFSSELLGNSADPKWNADFGRESGSNDAATTTGLVEHGSKPFRGLFGLFGRMKGKRDEIVEVRQSEDLRSVFLRYRTDEPQHGFGETTYLESERPPEETMLLSQVQFDESASAIAYLTRNSTNETIEIDCDIFKIGKEKKYVDFCIEDNATVSRSHADIVRKGNSYFIIDNNSTNHTYMNGEMIPSGEEVPLEDGAEIMLGNERLTFHCRSANDTGIR